MPSGPSKKDYDRLRARLPGHRDERGNVLKTREPPVTPPPKKEEQPSG